VASHSASVSGGITPSSGRQSTIDKPDSVSRVTPPNKIMPKIVIAQTANHPEIQRAFCGAAAIAVVIFKTPSPAILTNSLPKSRSALL